MYTIAKKFKAGDYYQYLDVSLLEVGSILHFGQTILKLVSPPSTINWNSWFHTSPEKWVYTSYCQKSSIPHCKVCSKNNQLHRFGQPLEICCHLYRILCTNVFMHGNAPWSVGGISFTLYVVREACLLPCLSLPIPPPILHCPVVNVVLAHCLGIFL